MAQDDLPLPDAQPLAKPTSPSCTSPRTGSGRVQEAGPDTPCPLSAYSAPAGRQLSSGHRPALHPAPAGVPVPWPIPVSRPGGRPSGATAALAAILRPPATMRPTSWDLRPGRPRLPPPAGPAESVSAAIAGDVPRACRVGEPTRPWLRRAPAFAGRPALQRPRPPCGYALLPFDAPSKSTRNANRRSGLRHK